MIETFIDVLVGAWVGIVLTEYGIKQCATLGVRLRIGKRTFSIVEVKNANR